MKLESGKFIQIEPWSPRQDHPPHPPQVGSQLFFEDFKPWKLLRNNDLVSWSVNKYSQLSYKHTTAFILVLLFLISTMFFYQLASPYGKLLKNVFACTSSKAFQCLSQFDSEKYSVKD